ncbi:MAG: HD domain-containing phosphohydrolase [Thiomicrospira sp.]
MTAISQHFAHFHIALVDDEPRNLDLLNEVLTEQGFMNRVSFTKATHLIGYLQQHEVDLILLDLNMPTIDGLGVLQWIKRHFSQPETPLMPNVIMLTAQADRAHRINALKQGAQDYITKPFDIEELVHRIVIQLEKRHLTKQLLQQNNNLEEQVQQRTQDLQAAYLEVVARLGKAAEYRDNETSNHVKRVSLFSEILAKKAGLSDEQAHLIRLASPMHDVGKIGISDHILLKPGKLTQEEYAQMQKHVEIGCEILAGANSPLLTLAHEIALTHHEKYDGSGYPNGLKGENIPLSGRIVAITDVFDALTSERPYKTAWAIDQALDLLTSEKGKHFDPNLVDLFLDAMPEVTAIIREYQDRF